jgi:hypothetical protein
MQGAARGLEVDMKRLLGALVVSLSLPSLALAGSWEKVSLVDSRCAAKVKENPDKHPVSCLLKCKDSGYGVQTASGFVKLDARGNELAVAELEKTAKKDAIRVNVTGEQKGDVIQVATLQIAE